jgi:hypothetical protein
MEVFKRFYLVGNDEAPRLELFSADELKEATRKLPTGKVPEPDDLLNEVVKIVSEVNPNVFLDAFNAC